MDSTLETLPSDVHDRLLCVLPDFTTLCAVVLSCKALHNMTSTTPAAGISRTSGLSLEDQYAGEKDHKSVE